MRKMTLFLKRCIAVLLVYQSEEFGDYCFAEYCNLMQCC